MGCVNSVDDTNLCSDSDVCTIDRCSAGACVAEAGLADEIASLQFSTGKDVLAWSLAPLGAGRRYQVIRGVLSGLPVGSPSSGDVCVTQTTANAIAVALAPSQGTGFWFLVRVRYTACGGSYGFEGEHGARGAPRVSAACP